MYLLTSFSFSSFDSFGIFASSWNPVLPVNAGIHRKPSSIRSKNWGTHQTEISIRFDSDFDSARILEEYETSFPEDINGATQYLRARTATYYTRKKLQIISEYGLSFDNLEELGVPFNFLGYYYPGMMTLDQIQYSIQKNNLQHLPDKGFSIMVLYDDIEASLD